VTALLLRGSWRWAGFGVGTGALARESLTGYYSGYYSGYY